MLVLVIGPSGVGKDTLLAEARRMLAPDARFRFLRRAITRPADKAPEGHEPLDEAEFLARRDAGGFALHWRTQGLYYGIPADFAADLVQGRVLVANVPRTLVAEAATRWPVRVIEVTAPMDLLARRLAARGQADALEAARRQTRPVKLPDVPREAVANDGGIEQGARRLVAALIRAGQAVPQAENSPPPAG